MVYAISYADNKYRNAQKLNTKTAYMYGVKKVIEYGPQDIDEEFKKKNKRILDCSRGNGYWLWKPYIIDRTLKKINEGDYLIYADAGAAYVNKVRYLIHSMEREQTDIMVFEITSIERCFTKRDAFVILDCDVEEYASSRQICATFLVLKRTKRAIRFIEEWLKYAQDERVITDQENVMGKPNYEGFVDHRHDQSILSLLTKKKHIEPFRDASQYGKSLCHAEAVLKKSDYPQIFDSHRNADVSSSWIVYHFQLADKWKKAKINIRICLSKIKRFILGRR